MKDLFKNGVLNVPMGKVEFLELPTVEITQDRFEELVKAEAQLDFVKKWVEGKTSYNNYADISDLIILLDIKKEQGATE